MNIKREVNITKDEPDKKEENVEIVKTEKKNIDVHVNNIRDILKIIEEYEYKPEIEYNIDLKSLHNIKEELGELDRMIGMETLKQSILDQLLYFLQELNIGKNISEYKHTVIYGSPGTGKTEVAKIIGKIYSKIGVLKKNIFKKVTRNDLIAGYLGQTAIKTRSVIDECMGGVLFIDEAYSLASKQQNDSFSKECIDTLCEALSDHKNEFMVIIAGYEEELNDTFFSSNRGLESRFIWRFKMDEYTAAEMMQIFKKKLMEQEWTIESDDILTVNWFDSKKEQFKSFGRDMEVLLSYTKIVHGRRIYGQSKELRKIINLEDMNKAYDMFLKNKNAAVKEKSSALTSMYI
ncbi:MAG: AAA family ATPase [Chlamydiae bacterium]|nr:AAA family ATPase [Chlamydiota bacterium]